MKKFCKTFLIFVLAISGNSFAEPIPVPVPVPDLVHQQTIPGLQLLTIAEDGENLVTRINGKRLKLLLQEEMTIEEGSVYIIEGIVGKGIIYVTKIRTEESNLVAPMLKQGSISLKPGKRVSLRGEFIITI